MKISNGSMFLWSVASDCWEISSRHFETELIAFSWKVEMFMKGGDLKCTAAKAQILANFQEFRGVWWPNTLAASSVRLAQYTCLQSDVTFARFPWEIYSFRQLVIEELKKIYPLSANRVLRYSMSWFAGCLGV